MKNPRNPFRGKIEYYCVMYEGAPYYFLGPDNVAVKRCPTVVCLGTNNEDNMDTEAIVQVSMAEMDSLRAERDGRPETLSSGSAMAHIRGILTWA